jgi:putative membrane protein
VSEHTIVPAGGPPFRHNRLLQWEVAWLVLFWLAMAVGPFDRFDWLLENLLVFIYGGLLLLTYRRFRFSNTSYTLFTVFLTLHLIGAHYTYAETPIGFWLQALFDLQRNHYDRMVHFSYGLLLAYPLRELLLRLTAMRPGWSYFVAVNLVLALSAFYEIIEMWVAQLVSPQLGAAYLGIQGDIWDAQRDMFLALCGAIVAMLFTWRRTAK